MIFLLPKSQESQSSRIYIDIKERKSKQTKYKQPPSSLSPPLSSTDAVRFILVVALFDFYFWRQKYALLHKNVEVVLKDYYSPQRRFLPL